MEPSPARTLSADRLDRDLLAEVGHASEIAFARLYRRHARAALNRACRVIGDRHLGEEVLQEVFLAVWTSAASYDAARGPVRAWILALAHHRAVDAIRRREAERRRTRLVVREPAGAPQPDDVVDAGWVASRRSQVRVAVDRLGARHRQVIELAYFDGLTQNQIAARTGVPLGTVKSRTAAALGTLRRTLTESPDG